MSAKTCLRGLVIGLLMLLTAACSGLAGEPRVVATLPPRATAVDVTALLNAADTSAGAAIFAENCIRCHGIDGKGKGELVQTGQIASIPDFTDPATTQDITPEEWYAIIRDGRIEKLMPPWGSALTGEEIAAVALYTYNMAGQDSSPAPAATEVVESQPAATPLPLTAGTIHGTVKNAGQPVSDGLEATLYVMNSEAADAQGHTAPVINGEFTFTDVTLVHGDAYVVAVTYNGLPFMSEATTPSADAATLEIPVTVYDVQTDPASIEIGLLLTEIQFQNDVLLFTQIVQFDNVAQAAYMRDTPVNEGQPVSVAVRLPDGARLMTSALQPGYVVSTDGMTVYDTQPVVPGVHHTMHVAYTAPFDGEAIFTLSVPYRMNNRAEIMLPPARLTLNSSQFTAQGTQQFASGTYDDYLAEPVAAGETLTFTVRRAAEPLNVSIPLAVGLSLMGIGLISLSVVMYIQSNRAMRLQPAAPQPTVESLAQTIAELDVRYQQGSIKERQYRKQRNALKKQLAALVGSQPSKPD